MFVRKKVSFQIIEVTKQFGRNEEGRQYFKEGRIFGSSFCKGAGQLKFYYVFQLLEKVIVLWNMYQL